MLPNWKKAIKEVSDKKIYIYFFAWVYCSAGPKDKWFPAWAFWWNLFEFFCNGDPSRWHSRGFASLGGASVEPRFSSLGGASLRSVEPRFARWSLASLGGASLRSVEPLASLGGTASLRSGGASLGWRPLKTVPVHYARRTRTTRRSSATVSWNRGSPDLGSPHSAFYRLHSGYRQSGYREATYS